MDNKRIIPIMVKIDGKEKIVYKDVSNLSVESLLKLRKCLMGTINESTMAIDNIIYNDILSNTHMGYDNSLSAYNKERKNYKKEQKRKMLKKWN